MNDRFAEYVSNELVAIESAGLFKHERQITTAQAPMWVFNLGVKF